MKKSFPLLLALAAGLLLFLSSCDDYETSHFEDDWNYNQLDELREISPKCHDIPTNVDEAYKFLDELLEDEDIEYIKNLSEEEVVSLYYNDFGQWISDHWIYSKNSTLTKTIFGPEYVPDDYYYVYDDYYYGLYEIREFIVTGYYHYLNGNAYTFETYMAEKQQEIEDRDYLYEEPSVIAVVIAILVSIALFVFIRVRFAKSPVSIGWLKKAALFKPLRITYIFIALAFLSLLAEAIDDMFWGEWWYTTVPFMIFGGIASVLALIALHCFTDMTKKQIALSAAVTSALLMILVIFDWEALLFSYVYYYIFYGFIDIYDYDFPEFFYYIADLLVKLTPFFFLLIAR
ncbi:MAG: hypothetical protein FWG33_05130, partial [Oscillospiraceae bacterium]|nr:hypothetical protein [Oscillospiraceae bacterium]